jgi:hypothetical protein
MFDKKALLYTKTTIVNFLRGYIYNSENYAHLLPDKITVEDIQAIKVYDGTPDVLTDFPMVVISGTTGNVQQLGLADFKQEQYNKFGDIIGYLYGGNYTFSLTMECASLSSYMNEFLADFLVSALRIYLYRKLEQKGILITQINYNGDSTVMDKNNVIYISNIGFSTFNQWSEYIDLLDIKNVTIDMDVEDKTKK